MAVNQVKNLRERPGVIFGSVSLFNKLKYNKGDQVQNKLLWKKSRDTGMFLRGDSGTSFGNRKARLDLENNQVIIKISKGNHFSIPIKVNKSRKADLIKLQKLCELKEAYFNVQINNGFICISFNEEILKISSTKPKFIKNRILSIDSNPNYLGLVVMDGTKIIHEEIIDFKDLNQKNIKSSKKKHEKHEATKRIIKLAVHYKCQAIGLEQLNVKAKDHKNGTTFNRLVNNTWHRNSIFNSLKKWCVIYQVEFIDVFAAYSSFIGCIQNPNKFDSIAAAIEINRRAKLVLQDPKRKRFIPLKFDSSSMPTRWKEMGLMAAISTGITTWKELFDWAKKSKISYRILFDRSKTPVNS